MPLSAASSADAAFRLMVLAPNPWLGQWVNRQQLFSRIGKRHPVLYSTGGWFSWDRGTPEWQSATWTGGIQSVDNVMLDEPAKMLTRVQRIAVLDELTMSLQCRRWHRLLNVGLPAPLIGYVFHPMFYPYVKHLKADKLVYHVYDMYDHMPGWSDTLDRQERDMIQAADLVVAASEAMAEGLRSKGAREVRVLPNGADVDAFIAAANNPTTEPSDMKDIPHPRLGWIGSLHPEVDYAMIAELASREPTWHFVLVGDPSPKSNPRAHADRVLCQSRPNVHFLGGRPIQSIPSYVGHMDVNLMCYRIADDMWIKAGYPLKLHEYLAAGHPVVSADIPSVRPFDAVVRIADDVDDWHDAVRKALGGRGQGTIDSRRAVAAQNSWDGRVATLSAWLVALTATSSK
jgi:glycosyltransferase involved in cell wall biosynthesis